MENEPSSNPAGEAVRVELQDIMTNKANPLHEGYWRKDPHVMNQIDQKYKAAYGGGTVDLSDGLTVAGLDRGQRPGSTEDAEAVSPEDAEADTRAIAQLHDEWSDQFDTNMEDARQGLTALSTTLGAGADDLIGAYLDAGGDRAVGIKALATYGQGRKT